jgi:hypothetical protein
MNPFGAGILSTRYVWLGITMNLVRVGLPKIAWYKVEVLCMIVLPDSEGNRESHLADWNRT